MIESKTIGLPKWDRNHLKNSLSEFIQLYQKRPILDNTGGMKSPHMFPAWFTIKTLQPKHIVESGIWKGQGTWFFEKASPNSYIHSIDVNLNNREYISKSPLVKYYNQDVFTLNLLESLPREDTLLFFDDHQNMFERLKRVKDMGFIHFMDEDNYPSGRGDCFSIKQAFEREESSKWLQSNLEVYYEFPPIFKGKTTRWNDDWDDKYPTQLPLLDFNENYNESFQIFIDEYTDYTWICYGKIKQE